jgi:phospholipid/cholesterol/gamma-HCH transport system substrate-binding protein
MAAAKETGFSTEQKVGFFFLVTLFALGFIIELVQDWRPFQKETPYRALFQSAVGIKVGDPVRLAGVEVGKVEGIGLDHHQVRVDFYVVEGTQVREDSVAAIRQTNLLGGQFLGLDFGTEGSPLLPPGSVVPTREGTNIDQLITNFDRNQELVLGQLGELIEENREPIRNMIAQLDEVARKIGEGEGTLGRLINDPKLYDDIQGAAASLKGIAQRLERGEGSLGRLMVDPTLAEDAAQTLANLRTMSDRVVAGKGTVGKLFVEEELYDNANATLAKLREVAEKIERGEGTLGKLVNDETLYRETEQTMSRLNSIATKIDEGQGTIGRLINDDDLYREAKTTLHKVEKTVDGMSDTGPLSALGVVLGTLF